MSSAIDTQFRINSQFNLVSFKSYMHDYFNESQIIIKTKNYE